MVCQFGFPHPFSRESQGEEGHGTNMYSVPSVHQALSTLSDIAYHSLCSYQTVLDVCSIIFIL